MIQRLWMYMVGLDRVSTYLAHVRWVVLNGQKTYLGGIGAAHR